jgi:radical SAM superfamily enzyme YgiQ (UPF0313 family)
MKTMQLFTIQNHLSHAVPQADGVLLISCYELGHQPAGISMPLGFLQREGLAGEAMDLSVEGIDPAKILRADFIGISVPMHTALRLGINLATEIRQINADCHICFYGLYASLNGDYLLETVADSIIGGEFELPLVQLIKALKANQSLHIEGVKTRTHEAAPLLARLPFTRPERRALPQLEKYARLQYEGEERLTGYVEASRGCLHHCTHCPIPPVYEGRFFVVPADILLEDIRGLVAAGARHITFGDPDFLNGPTHSLRLVRAMHAEFPQLTFDCTVKVEHIIKHQELFAEFARLGCIFVVSAVESLSDRVLAQLEKGHTREDVFTALAILRRAGIALRPSLVAFTPWTTLDDFIELIEFVEAEGLLDAVDPVQFSIRLLVPPGSVLLRRRESSNWLGKLNQQMFTYEWQHPDRRLDELQKQVAAVVEEAAQSNEDAMQTFYRISDLAYAMRGADPPPGNRRRQIDPLRSRPPRLSEAWFCCAEPTRNQMISLKKESQGESKDEAYLETSAG